MWSASGGRLFRPAKEDAEHGPDDEESARPGRPLRDGGDRRGNGRDAVPGTRCRHLAGRAAGGGLAMTGAPIAVAVVAAVVLVSAGLLMLRWGRVRPSRS